MSPSATWNEMGIAARVVVALLATFACLLVFIVAERFVVYRRAGRPSPAKLRRRLHTLATIKVTAPMLGLLGTILGLINASAGMAMTGVVDVRAVGAGLAEALVTTAIGLVIGLPAWWAHSFYDAWAERSLARADALSAR